MYWDGGGGDVIRNIIQGVLRKPVRIYPSPMGQIGVKMTDFVFLAFISFIIAFTAFFTVLGGDIKHV